MCRNGNPCILLAEMQTGKEMRSAPRRVIYTYHIHYSFTHSGQDMKTIQVFIDRWVDKEIVEYIYTHTYIYIQWDIIQP